MTIGRRMAIGLAVASAVSADLAAPARAQSNSELLARNPILQEMQRVAPDRVPAWLDQLNTILQQRTRGSSNGKEPPPDIKKVLDRNPDFKLAFPISQDGVIKMIEDMLKVR